MGKDVFFSKHGHSQAEMSSPSLILSDTFVDSSAAVAQPDFRD